MAHKFVKVRRVGDPSVTAEIAEISLPRWEGFWELIPEGDTETVQHSPASEQPPSEGEHDEGSKTSKTSRSRSSAASKDKE